MTNERSWEYEDGAMNRITLTASALRALDVEGQRRVMKQWFLDQYENPFDAGRPIEDGEIYHFNGGPYYPEYELVSEFEGIVPDSVMSDLARELEAQCHEWDGRDDSYFEDMFPPSKTLMAFRQSIADVMALLDVELPDGLAAMQHKMLYCHVFTAMETYLSDTFITLVLADRRFMRRFVESTPQYGNEKFALADLYNVFDEIEKRAKRTFRSVMWHSLDKVLKMYKDTLGVMPVHYPVDILKAVPIRHDLVHRNGVSADGLLTEVNRDTVEKLAAAMLNFVNDLARAVDDALV
jgi:hypothetical protein